VGKRKWRHDTRHDDIQHNNIQHNDTQHTGIICDIQPNNIQHNDTERNNALPFCWLSRFIDCYAECHYAECHYAECHYPECRGANEGKENSYKKIFSRYFETQDKFAQTFLLRHIGFTSYISTYIHKTIKLLRWNSS
jgi:hypothetical protein